MSKFLESIIGLKNSKVVNVKVHYFSESTATETADVDIELDSRVHISFSFWRLIELNRTLSFLDHKQQYGGKEPIDAHRYLERSLEGKIIRKAFVDPQTGDIFIEFEKMKLQILSLNGFENWEISFPSGAVEYSNHFETKLAN